MREIDFSEQNRKILVIGGLFKDVEMSGEGHSTVFDSKIGGAAYNVAFALSKIGFEVYFGTVYPENYYEKIYENNLKIFPLKYPSKKGIFLYKEKKIMGVERTTRIKIIPLLKDILTEKKFLAFFSTFELGSDIVNDLSVINADWKFLDPSPWFEGEKIIDYEIFDYVLPNRMEMSKIERLPFEKSVVKDGTEGIFFNNNNFENEEIGVDKFGNGDLFDAIFISKIVSGENTFDSIKTAMRGAVNFSISDKNFESFVLEIMQGKKENEA
jgi:hypothetical protein